MPGEFSVTDFGAVGDGVTDSTAAFASTLAAISGLGGGVMHIPPSPAPYLLPNGFEIGGVHNLTILGHGAEIKTTNAQRSALATFSPSDSSKHYALDPSIVWYALSPTASPFVRGASSVELANAGALLDAGDVVWVRARGLVPGTETHTPVAEMNVVASVAGTTVNLQYPLAKDYDYDPIRLFAIGKATSFCRNLTIEGLSLRNVSQRALCAYQVLNCSLRDVKVYGSSGVLVRGRFVRADNLYAEIVPAWSSGFRPFTLALDTGTCDVDVRGMQSVSSGHSTVHLHEGCANVRIQGAVRNASADAGTTEEWGVLSVRALSWDIDLDMDVTNAPRGAALDSHNSSKYPAEGNVNLRWRGTFSGSTRPGFGVVKQSGLAVDTSGMVVST